MARGGGDDDIYGDMSEFSIQLGDVDKQVYFNIVKAHFGDDDLDDGDTVEPGGGGNNYLSALDPVPVPGDVLVGDAFASETELFGAFNYVKVQAGEDTLTATGEGDRLHGDFAFVENAIRDGKYNHISYSYGDDKITTESSRDLEVNGDANFLEISLSPRQEGVPLPGIVAQSTDTMDAEINHNKVTHTAGDDDIHVRTADYSGLIDVRGDFTAIENEIQGNSNRIVLKYGKDDIDIEGTEEGLVHASAIGEAFIVNDSITGNNNIITHLANSRHHGFQDEISITQVGTAEATGDFYHHSLSIDGSGNKAIVKLGDDEIIVTLNDSGGQLIANNQLSGQLIANNQLNGDVNVITHAIGDAGVVSGPLITSDLELNESSLTTNNTLYYQFGDDVMELTQLGEASARVNVSGDANQVRLEMSALSGGGGGPEEAIVEVASLSLDNDTMDESAVNNNKATYKAGDDDISVHNAMSGVISGDYNEFISQIVGDDNHLKLTLGKDDINVYTDDNLGESFSVFGDVDSVRNNMVGQGNEILHLATHGRDEFQDKIAVSGVNLAIVMGDYDFYGSNITGHENSLWSVLGNDYISVSMDAGNSNQDVISGDVQLFAAFIDVGENMNNSMHHQFGNDTMHVTQVIASTTGGGGWELFAPLAVTEDEPADFTSLIYGDVRNVFVEFIEGEDNNMTVWYGNDSIFLDRELIEQPDSGPGPLFTSEESLPDAEIPNIGAVIYGDAGGITHIDIRTGEGHHVALHDGSDTIVAGDGEQIIIADSVYKVTTELPDDPPNPELLLTNALDSLDATNYLSITRGDDEMTGGAGNDTFAFQFLEYTDADGEHLVGIGEDTIHDFQLSNNMTTDEGDLLFFMLYDENGDADVDSQDLINLVNSVSADNGNTMINFIDGSTLELVGVTDDEVWIDGESWVSDMIMREQLRVGDPIAFDGGTQI